VRTHADRLRIRTRQVVVGAVADAADALRVEAEGAIGAERPAHDARQVEAGDACGAAAAERQTPAAVAIVAVLAHISELDVAVYERERRLEFAVDLEPDQAARVVSVYTANQCHRDHHKHRCRSTQKAHPTPPLLP
jgi:hypothetical protein